MGHISGKKDTKGLIDTRIDKVTKEIANEDDLLSYWSKKTRRYVSVLYIATQHIDSSEPIRNAIRAESLNLVFDPGGVTHRQFTIQLSRILALLEVAALSGLVSLANVSILRREAYLLIELARRHANYLDEGFKDVHQSVLGEHELSRPVHKVESPSLAQGLHAKAKASESSQQSDASSRLQRGRYAEDILGVLESGKKLSISQIRALVPSIPSKTLQRELAYLVAKGTLNKAGSRRWSTYEKASG